MSTSPCLDINLMTPTCVVWESDNATESLIEPDPPTRSMLFESQFDSKTTSASFIIHCPIRLKGIDSHSHILALIPTRAITSFAFKVYPNPPESVRKKLNCSTVRLRFSLDQPLYLVAPAAATEPVQPRKRLSAEVLNTLRSLAKAPSLDIYVSDRELPHSKLNTVRDAVAQTLLKPFDADLPTTLASLYNGRGGQLVDLSTPRTNTFPSQSDEPPAYHELELPPPSAIEPTTLAIPKPLAPEAPLTGGNDKKRRRLDDSSSSNEIDIRVDLISVVVEELAKRVKQVEKENKELNDKLDEMHKVAKRVEQLEQENKELNYELDVLRASCEKATDGVDADEVALLEMQDDLNELTDQVDFLTKNGLDSEVELSIVKKVTKRAVANIMEKLSNEKS